MRNFYSVRWMAVLAAVVGMGAVAQAGTYKRVESVSNAWMQAHYDKSQQLKADQGVDKMCAAGSALYKLTFEPGEMDDTESFIRATMELVTVPLDNYVASLPEAKTKMTFFIAKLEQPLVESDAAKYVGRVLDSEELKQDITSKMADFEKTKKFLHADMVYRRRLKPGDPILDNLLRAYVVIDTETNEAMVVGNGDCQF